MPEVEAKPLGWGTIIAILLAVSLGLGFVLGGLLNLPTSVTGAGIGGAVGAIGAILLGRRRAASRD